MGRLQVASEWQFLWFKKSKHLYCYQSIMFATVIFLLCNVNNKISPAFLNQCFPSLERMLLSSNKNGCIYLLWWHVMVNVLHQKGHRKQKKQQAINATKCKTLLPTNWELPYKQISRTFADISPDIYGNVYFPLFPNVVCWVHNMMVTEKLRLKSFAVTAVVCSSRWCSCDWWFPKYSLRNHLFSQTAWRFWPPAKWNMWRNKMRPGKSLHE